MQKNLIKTYLSEAEKQAYKTQSAQWSIVYPTILVDLLVAWAMLLIGFIPFVLLRDNPVGSLVLVLPMALYLSFWKQSYITFFHEAAHFNIHHNRKINDRLANFFFSRPSSGCGSSPTGGITGSTTCIWARTATPRFAMSRR